MYLYLIQKYIQILVVNLQKLLQQQQLLNLQHQVRRTKKERFRNDGNDYGYVYVAQVAIGADKNQTIKAIQEAEAYEGPSLIIAYAPCINHGIKNGMGTTIAQEKKAVETGYWHLYRYNPRLKEEGKNPFILDSKEPTKPLKIS